MKPLRIDPTRKSMSRTMRLLLLIAFVLTASFLCYFFTTFLRFRQQVKVASTKVQMVALHAATTNFYARIGYWPPEPQALVSNSLNLVFISPPPPWRDAWNRPIIFTQFSSTSSNGSVLSYGRDGIPGGVGFDADIGPGAGDRNALSPTIRAQPVLDEADNHIVAALSIRWAWFLASTIFLRRIFSS